MPLHCQRQKPSGSWTVTDLLQSSAEDAHQLECMDLYFRLMSSNANNVCGMHTSVATVIVGICWTQAGNVGSCIQVGWRFQYAMSHISSDVIIEIIILIDNVVNVIITVIIITNTITIGIIIIVISMGGRNSSDADLLGALLFLGGRQEQVCQVILVQLQHVAAHSKCVLARVPVQDIEQLCDASRCQPCRHRDSCIFTREGTYTPLHSSDRQRSCRSCRTHAL